MKVRIIELEGDGAEVMSALERLLDGERVVTPTGPAGKDGGSKRPRECKRCGYGYSARAHREAHLPPGVTLPPRHQGRCGRCGHGVSSAKHREECRGETPVETAVRPPASRCARCGGSFIKDGDEVKCLSCGRPSAVVMPTVAPKHRTAPRTAGMRI